MECPPCLEEMKKFEDLIKNNDQFVRIISISINSYEKWKQAFDNSNKKFSFLAKSVKNWQHLVIKSEESSELNNDIPSGNTQFLLDRFQSHNYPMYFVLDNKGTIISTPFSAVDYLREKVAGENKLMLFLKDDKAWPQLLAGLSAFFIEYSGYFWVLIFAILFVFRIFYSSRLKFSNNKQKA